MSDLAVEQDEAPIDLAEETLLPNQLRFNNITATLTGGPDQSDEALEQTTQVSLEISGCANLNLGKVEISNLNGSVRPLDVIEYLQEERETDSLISPKQLQKCLDTAERYGGKIRSNLGRNPRQIANGYTHKCKTGPEREDIVSRWSISRSSKTCIEETKNNATDDHFSWVDINTAAGNRLDSLEAIEEYLDKKRSGTEEEGKELKELPPLEDHIFLDLRVLSAEMNETEVNRHKLYVLLGNDSVMTIHDGELDIIKTVADNFKEDKYSSSSREHNKIGTGFVFARILNEAVTRNEKTLRELETTTEFIHRELEEDGPLSNDQFMQDMPSLERTSRYIMRKLRDSLRVFGQLREALDGDRLKGVFGQMNDHRARQKIADLENQVSILADRAKDLEARVQEVEDYHRVLLEQRSSEIQKKIAIVEAVTLPAIVALSVIDVLPNFLEFTQASVTTMIVGTLFTVGLLARARFSRWM